MRPVESRHPAGIMLPDGTAGACRALADALGWRFADGVLGLVSAHRAEGSSTVAAGIALALARETRGRVLLLDVGVDHPSQAVRFAVGPDAGPGADLDASSRLEAVTREVAPGLWLLAAGPMPVGVDPLGAVRDGALLARCRASFTWTVVDLPPLVDTPGAAAVAAQCDCCVLVGRYRSTRLDALTRAAGMLPSPPAACVMTAWTSPLPGWLSRIVGSGRGP